jgi:hypothetical protein
MKRTIVFSTSIIALLMLATVTSAGAATRIHVTVPFDCCVGEQQMSAGSYIFEMRALGFGSSSSSAVAIYNPDGNFAYLTPTMPTGYDYRSSEAHLHFKRYGNIYFLSKVEGPQSGAGVRMTKAEREYRVQIRRPQDVVLLAVKQSLPAGLIDKPQLQPRPRLIVQQSDALR